MMPRAMITPTPAQELNRWIDLTQRASSLCTDWHSEIALYRRLYEGVHYKGRAKPSEPRFPDPTYTNTVDTCVGILLADDMQWKAQGWKPALRTEEKTSQIEKYLTSIIWINTLRESYDIQYETDLQLARDGASVLYSVWDPFIAKEVEAVLDRELPTEEGKVGPVRVYLEPPLRLQVIDPLKITMLPGGKRRYTHVFRTEQMSIYDVEQIYGVRLQVGKGMSPSMKMLQRGRFIDCWEFAEVAEAMPDPENPGQSKINVVTGQVEINYKTAVRNAILFDHEFVRNTTVMPGYTDLPYTIGFFKPVSRDVSRNWGHSIIKPLIPAVEQLEKAVNRRARQIDVFSSLPVMTKTLPSRKVQIDPGLGNVVRLSTDEDMGFPQWPGNPPDVAAHIDFLRSRIQQSGFSDVLLAPGQDQGSGFALLQLSDQNRIRLEQPIRHLELLWTSWARLALHLTATFAKHSLIRSYGQFKGEDFADEVFGGEMDDFMVRARLRPEYPAEKVRKHAMANQVRGVISEHTIMERYLDIERPDEERQWRLIEQAESHPLMQNYAIIKELKRRVTEEKDEAAAMTLDAMMQKGLPGTPGRPEEPVGTTQPTGLQSSTGDASRQAEGIIPDGAVVPRMDGSVTP